MEQIKKVEIEKFNPCNDALIFRKKFNTFKEAWEQCERGDWMLWIAKKLDIDIKKLTLAKFLCAKTVIHLMKDKRSITALELAEKFALTDDVSLDELDDAASDAADAAASASADAAASASYASDAADAAASASADAAASASYASYAAAAAASASADAAASYASYAAAADAASCAAAAASCAAAASFARIKNRKQTADICREVLTKEVFYKIDRL